MVGSFCAGAGWSRLGREGAGWCALEQDGAGRLAATALKAGNAEALAAAAAVSLARVESGSGRPEGDVADMGPPAKAKVGWRRTAPTCWHQDTKLIPNILMKKREMLRPS